MYSFRFYKDARDAIECETMNAMRHAIRCYSPCSTIFRAIATAPGRHTVILLSPYMIGPVLVGFLSTD
jgi:hypothetical protein